MLNKKGPIILFFIAGMIPTADEMDKAQKLGTMKFRSAKLASDPADPLEKCDAVAGLVPDRYAEKYPTAFASEEDMLRAEEQDATPPPAPTARTKKKDVPAAAVPPIVDPAPIPSPSAGNPWDQTPPPAP